MWRIFATSCAAAMAAAPKTAPKAGIKNFLQISRSARLEMSRVSEPRGVRLTATVGRSPSNNLEAGRMDAECAMPHWSQGRACYADLSISHLGICGKRASGLTQEGFVKLKSSVRWATLRRQLAYWIIRNCRLLVRPPLGLQMNNT